jgi:hypothetical protein
MEAASERWTRAYATRPHGIVIWSPPNGPLNFGRLDGRRGGDRPRRRAARRAADRHGDAGHGARLLFATLLGVLAWLAIDVPYWNGFPGRSRRWT